MRPGRLVVAAFAAACTASLALLAAPAAAQVVVSCSTDPNIFNTGYNATTGGILPNNARDANWQVAGRFPQTAPASLVMPPPAGANFAPANVGNLADFAWVNASALAGNAQWIAQETLANPTSTNGDWYYRYQFTLAPTVNPASFQLGMNFYADNTAVEVFVNGVAQRTLTTGLPQNGNPPATNPYIFEGFRAGRQAVTLLNNNWLAGLNTFVVQVKSGADYEGFLSQIRPNVPLCGATPSVSVFKSADVAAVSPGGTAVYTVSVSNSGSVAANNTTVSDAVPVGVSAFSTTCAASGGAVCPNGAGPRPGALNETVATLPAGGAITYTVTATIASNPPDPVVNNVSVSPPSGGLCSPGNTAPPCTATSSLARAAQPDLGINLSGLRTSATAGTPYSSSFTCTNSGNADATAGTSCSVSGLPAGLTVGACTISPADAAWSAGAPVPAGQTVTCPVSGTPSSAGTANVSGTTGATGDSNPANNTAGTTITVDSASPSATDVLTSVAPPPSAAAGSTVSVPVTFANVGAATVPVSYSLQLPTGLTGVTCTGSGVTCSYAPGSGVVTLTGLPASLASGQSIPFSLNYTAPAAGTPVPLTSTISTSANEANTSNNSATGTTTTSGAGGKPDVVASVAAPTTTAPNSTVSVPVTFNNVGDATAGGVSYTLSLPMGLSGVSCAAPATCSYDSSTGTVSVTGLPATLAPGAAAGLTLSYTAPASGVVQTSATVAATTAGETNTANNSASGNTTVAAGAASGSAADVSIMLTPPASAAPGATVNVAVTVANAGPQSAAGVGYTLNLPTGLAGVSCSGAGVTCNYDPATGVVTLSGLPTTLNANQSASFSLNYTAPASGQVPVSASISTTTSDPNSANNTASANTAVGVADVATAVSAPASAVAGTTVNVPVSFSNGGAITANGVSYAISLTGSPSNVSLSNGGVACGYSGGAVTGCGLPTSLAPGQGVNLIVSFNAPATGPVGITSTIATTSAETSTGNNTSSGSTAVTATPAPDLSINLAGLQTSATVGSLYNGSFSCTNAGNANATAGTSCSVSGLPAGVTVGACTISPAAAPWMAGDSVPAGRTVSCTVSGTPTAPGASTITGSTDVTGDLTPANNRAARDVTVTPAAPPAAVQPIPSLSEWAMLLLTGLIALVGLVRLRRRG